MLGHPQNPTCNTQKGRTLANHTPRKCGSGRDSLCRIPGTQGQKAFSKSRESKSNSQPETIEEPGARAQDEIPAVSCHMTQAESFPITQKKNLKDKNELAILTCSKGFPQRESQAFSPLQGDTTHVPAHQVLCGQGQLRAQEAVSHCRK